MPWMTSRRCVEGPSLRCEAVSYQLSISRMLCMCISLMNKCTHHTVQFICFIGALMGRLLVSSNLLRNSIISAVALFSLFAVFIVLYSFLSLLYS